MKIKELEKQLEESVKEYKVVESKLQEASGKISEIKQKLMEVRRKKVLDNLKTKRRQSCK